MAATITDYAGLRAALTSYIDRGTDLDSWRDDWLLFAEAYFNRVLRMVQMEEESSLTTDSSGNATLPGDFLAPRSVRRIGTPNIELLPISMRGENNLSPYDTADVARFYSVSGTTLRVTPIEEGTNLLTLTYYEKIPALTSSNTTNWLLSLAPDVYFYRCLGEAWAYMRDFEKAASYKAYADTLISELKGLDEQARYHSAGIVYDGVVG